MTRYYVGLTGTLLVLAITLGSTDGFSAGKKAQPWDAEGQVRSYGKPLQARPWVFVGTAAQCGTAGSKIVTSGWLAGMGLPDNGTTLNTAAAAAYDPHTGLLLNKNGPTSNCSASGATIEGLPWGGTTISELGFDYRIGGHCGAGAPRFNIVTTTGVFYFAGCNRGAESPAPQDPAKWTRVRFATGVGFVDPADPSSPAFVFGVTRVKSIEIVFDEGTDTPSLSDPTGVGLAVLDNIDIGGKLITRGKGVVPSTNFGWGFGRKYADN
jgi:hypothetical protein